MWECHLLLNAIQLLAMARYFFFVKKEEGTSNWPRTPDAGLQRLTDSDLLSTLRYMRPSSPDTAATLTHAKNLPMGIHDVDIDVQDQQSVGRVQTVRVRICECRNGVCLAKERSVTFGPMGLLALLLPLFLLLLLCESDHC